MVTDQLASIVGPAHVITSPEDLEPHVTEWRRAVRGRPLALVRPGSTDEVAQVVSFCAEHSIAVVPQGGNTGLCAGAIPDDSGKQLILSLSRMNRIRQVNPADSSIVVEAGCILHDVQEAAAAANRLFPLSLSAEGSCQIGGNLSTDAGGINVIRYGTASEQCLGLEVVLANGEIWNGLRSLRKNTAGYDLKQLFLGSEGTLGIITAAVLRLFPQPASLATAFVALPTAGNAVDLLAVVREALGDSIVAFELVSERALGLVAQHIPDGRLPFDLASPWGLLLEVETRTEAVESVLGIALEQGLISDATIAKNGAERARLWHLRHSISAAQRFEGACLKHDIGVPVDQIPALLERGEALLEQQQPAARLVAFGHVGDGNLHYNVVQPVAADADEFLAQGPELTAAIYDIVVDLGGTISAEHGIGTLKKPWLERYTADTDLDLMRRLKTALDPANLLNPGKVI